MLDAHTLRKIFSSKIMEKAVAAFDRSTLSIVAASWIAAIVLLGLATYTVSQSMSMHRSALSAQAVEPILPTVSYDQLNNRDVQPIVERLKTQAAGITFNISNSGDIRISTQDGSLFRQWLMTLSYIVSSYPQYNWSLQDLCVGTCKGDLMTATVKAERVVFTKPQKPAKK